MQRGLPLPIFPRTFCRQNRRRIGRAMANRVPPPPEGVGGALVGLPEEQRSGQVAGCQETEARYRALIEAFDGFLYTIGPDRRIEFVSPNYSAHLGRDVVGEVCHQALYGRQSACPWCAADRVGQGEAVRFEVLNPTDRRWYDVVQSPIRHPDGRTSLQTLALDIDERKRAVENQHRLASQLLRHQKLESLAKMAGGMAHEFNNLLMVVSGNLDLLGRNLIPDSPARWCLVEMQTAARRAAELIRHLSAMAGDEGQQRQEVSLGALIRELGPSLGDSLFCPVRILVGADLPPVMANAEQLREVIRMLVANARAAIGDKDGTITLAAGARACDRAFLDGTAMGADLPSGEYAFFEVADTGVGMDAAVRSRLFEPFFTTRSGGRGWGLPTVQGIVRSHKGTIEVQSEPGKGSTFRVFLPLPSVSAGLASDLAAAGAGWLGSGKILLADDADSVRLVGAAFLEELGFEVVAAADGVEALAILKEQRRNLVAVLLDLTMPRLDGIETLRRLRQHWPDLPVFLMSGHAEEAVAERLAGNRVAGFLEKPFQRQALANALARVLPARARSVRTAAG